MIIKKILPTYTPMKNSSPSFAICIVAATLIPQGLLLAAGPAAVNLRSAAPFTILAATTITTTGGGTINGNVGLSPNAGSAIHLTQAQVNGTIYAVDGTGPPGSVIAPSLLGAAMGDLTTAYNEARDRVPSPTGAFLNPGAGNLGGLTLSPGLYKFDAAAMITGSDLTLTGGPDDVWIFQVGSDLQVGNGIQIILVGGAQARNIFWQVGTAAVIGTTAVFKGNILADQSVTMNTGSTIDGRALASNAAVTYNGSGGSFPVAATPYFTGISRANNGAVTLTLETTPYFQVTLQTSTDLTPNSWTNVTTDYPTATPWTYTHVSGQATGPKRFYRAFLTQ